MGSHTCLKGNSAYCVGRGVVITAPMCNLTAKEVHKQEQNVYSSSIEYNLSHAVLGHGSMLLSLQLCRVMLAMLTCEQ